MLDSLIALQGYLSQIYFVTGQSPQPVGSQHPSIVPYGSFPTSDGHVIVACLTERFWHNFARCLGHEDLIADPRFAMYEQRLANRDALQEIIQDRMTRDTTSYWLTRLSEFDVPNAPILSIGEALEQPHIKERRLIEMASHPTEGSMRLVRSPIRFDGEGPSAARAPSLLGEDTTNVLGKTLGLREEEIAALVSKGVDRD